MAIFVASCCVSLERASPTTALKAFPRATSARLAGVSQRASCQPFRDWDASLEAVGAEAFKEFERFLTEAVAGRERYDALTAMGPAYVDFCEANKRTGAATLPLPP